MNTAMENFSHQAELAALRIGGESDVSYGARVLAEHTTILQELLDYEVKKKNKSLRAAYETANTTCPKCRSKEVVDHIRRVEGSMSGSGYHTLFYGESHMSGSTDTNAVNACNACGNEWKKPEWSYTDPLGVLDGMISPFYYQWKTFLETGKNDAFWGKYKDKWALRFFVPEAILSFISKEERSYSNPISDWTRKFMHRRDVKPKFYEWGCPKIEIPRKKKIGGFWSNLLNW